MDVIQKLLTTLSLNSVWYFIMRPLEVCTTSVGQFTFMGTVGQPRPGWARELQQNINASIAGSSIMVLTTSADSR
jgi:hypothetical protein